jgi:transposase-like protein
VGGRRIHCAQDRLHSQTLLEWIKRDEVDSDERRSATTSERERLRALKREVKELRRANEILKLASAFFAQAELDRRIWADAWTARLSAHGSRLRAFCRGHLPAVSIHQ